MKTLELIKTNESVPTIVVGCMRISEKSQQEVNSLIHTAIENGAYFFDHADIYGSGLCEEIFGNAWHEDTSLKREDMFIQSKCGIVPGLNGYYDASKKHILESVDGILKRLRTDYLDSLLLHRPDALIEPEEVADAFDILYEQGKVKRFGLSNCNSMQIELLKKYAHQDILFNQMQLSIPVSNMIASGMEVNMETPGAINRDGSILDYCRLNDITLQAWSPFQMPSWRGCFIDSPDYEDLNKVLDRLAEKYQASKTAISTAWILRHPANIQVIAGTTSEERLKDIISACDIELTRPEWYELYLAAGHPLP